jgi:Tfp pilus assembly protein PilX
MRTPPAVRPCRPGLPSIGSRVPAGERGFVLVVVLVLLVTLTLLVVSQVRQSAVSQNIAMNSSRYMQAETAAQSVLRFCEAAVMQSVGQPQSVRVTTPGLRGTDTAAWRAPAKWAASAVTFDPAEVAFPGVVNYSCMFEDATADLVPSMMANDINAESGAFVPVCEVQAGMSPRLCKYRITARVVLDQGRQLHLQSEIRFAI